MSLNQWGDSEKKKVEKMWDGEAVERQNRFTLNWLSHETIVSRVNKVRFGDPEVWPDMWFKEHFVPQPVDRALSLGCGAGEFERCLLSLGICNFLDACDISRPAIKKASELAEAQGIKNARFFVQDINEIRIDKGKYDIVFFHHSLHHFLKLEYILGQVSRGLNRKGLIYMDDFIGPSRFQWTERQLKVMNDILSILPARYRAMKDKTGKPLGLKNRIYRPALEAMIQADPSEAARSAEIIELVSRKFKIVKRLDYGGTIMQSLLGQIAFNFDPQDEKDNTILNLIALFEKTLIETGCLTSDFTLIVAQKKGPMLLPLGQFAIPWSKLDLGTGRSAP